MAKINAINPILLLSKRCYAVASEGLRIQMAGTGMRQGTVSESASASANVSANKEQIFWMRDPKSGNWIPENHFGDDEVDAAELREKFLSKRPQKP